MKSMPELHQLIVGWWVSVRVKLKPVAEKKTQNNPKITPTVVLNDMASAREAPRGTETDVRHQVESRDFRQPANIPAAALASLSFLYCLYNTIAPNVR
jgi:hypothetical protein